MAAGKLIWIRIGLVGEREAFEQFHCLEACFCFGNAQSARGGQDDVFDDGHVWEQVEVLKHHSDTTANRVCVEARNRDVFAVEIDLAVVNGLEQVDATQQCALAGTARTNEGHNGAFRDVECDSVQNNVRAIRLADCMERKLRGHRTRVPVVRRRSRSIM